MAISTTKSKEKPKLLLDPGRRRSMRVLLSVPIHVYGKDKENQDFTEETRTLVVNAHGALISLGAHVTPGQQITVENKSTALSLDCRVVHHFKKSGNLFGADEWFITLHVDVNIRGYEVRYFMHALGAAAVRR